MPLSWHIHPFLRSQTDLQLYPIQLTLSRRIWLPFADLPHCSEPAQVANLLRPYAPQGFVLRGCPPELFSALKQHFSGQALCTGREALLHLQSGHFERKKIRDLVRRGHRHGRVCELKHTDSSRPSEILGLYQQVTARYPVQLRHLYRHSPGHSLRLFGFESEAGQLLGLISLSRSGFKAWHTEHMLRRPGAPVGVMAALLAGVFETLQAEGHGWWSLGEVPFYPLDPPKNFKEKLLIQAGRSLEPVYSAQGLLQFKAKFRPIWRPVYLFGTPDLSWAVLWDLFHSSRCSALALKALQVRGSSWLQSH